MPANPLDKGEEDKQRLAVSAQRISDIEEPILQAVEALEREQLPEGGIHIDRDVEVQAPAPQFQQAHLEKSSHILDGQHGALLERREHGAKPFPCAGRRPLDKSVLRVASGLNQVEVSFDDERGETVSLRAEFLR